MQQHHFLIRKFAHRNAFLPGKPVPVGYHGIKCLLADLFACNIPIRSHAEGKVNPSRLELCKQVAVHVLRKMKHDSRIPIFLLKPLHDGRNEIRGNAVEIPQGYCAARSGSKHHLPRHAHAFLERCQHARCVCKKKFPIRSQRNTPVFPRKQGDLQVFFQLRNGIAQAGLGNMQRFRRFGIIEHTGKRLKIAQLHQGHRWSSLAKSLFSIIKFRPYFRNHSIDFFYKKV